MSLEKRIERLEAGQTRRTYQMVAAEFQMDWRELMEEGEMFFAMPLAEQLAEVDRLHAAMLAEGMTMDDAEAIKATLIRESRP